jgi:Cdc6-like AAA superfamily ATPase
VRLHEFEQQTVQSNHFTRFTASILIQAWKRISSTSPIHLCCLLKRRSTRIWSAAIGLCHFLLSRFVSTSFCSVSCRVVLLYGPPGTGKTSLCKALAQKLSIRLSNQYPHSHFIEINAHRLAPSLSAFAQPLTPLSLCSAYSPSGSVSPGRWLWKYLKRFRYSSPFLSYLKSLMFWCQFGRIWPRTRKCWSACWLVWVVSFLLTSPITPNISSFISQMKSRALLELVKPRYLAASLQMR